jgi:hypothetical protein
MRISTLSMAVLLTVISFPAMDTVADEKIYRWVDEDGVVHFGDQRGVNSDAETITIKAESPNTAPPSQADTQAGSGQPLEPQVSIAQQRRNERAEKRREAEEMRQAVDAGCKQRRQLVAQLEPSPRVMVKDEDGTVKRMDDDKRLEILAEAQTYIAEKCNQ